MEKNVKEIILDIISEYNYESIILFGSRARNEHTQNSDYDLLIIMKEEKSIMELRKIQSQIRTKLALNNIDADVLVKTKFIIDEFKNKQGNVIYNALQEGVKI